MQESIKRDPNFGYLYQRGQRDTALHQMFPHFGHGFILARKALAMTTFRTRWTRGIFGTVTTLPLQ